MRFSSVLNTVFYLVLSFFLSFFTFLRTDGNSFSYLTKEAKGSMHLFFYQDCSFACAHLKATGGGPGGGGLGAFKFLNFTL